MLMSESKPKISKQILQNPNNDLVKNTITISTIDWFGIGLSVLAFLLYASTINHGFVLDDGLVTTLNSYVKEGFGGLWKIFSHSYRAGASITTDSDYMYRPLSVMMFAKEWEFFPNNPKIHHFFNVLFYSLSIYFLFKLLNKIFGEKYFTLIVFSSLIFLVHPIHTEVVSNIKSRDEIMSLFFSLISLIFVLKASDNNKNSIYIACITFFFSLLSKEGAAIILVIAPLTLYFFNKPQIVKISVFLLITFIIWFLIRKYFLGEFNYKINNNDNQIVLLSLSDRWATSLLVLFKYLKLMIWPNPLSWDYSLNAIPNQNWSSIQAIISLLLHFSAFVFALINIKTKNIFSYLILAYFATLALYSNVFIIIGTLMGERLVYFSSLWFILLFVFLIAKFFKFDPNNSDLKSNNILYSIFGIICIIFSFLTLKRSSDWKENFTLFSKDVINQPNSFRTHQALGDESLQKFMKLYKNPNDSVRYIHLAEKHHRISSEISKNFSNQVGLGNALLIQNKFEEALPYFLSAKNFNDGDVIKERIFTTYYRCGVAYAKDSNNIIKGEYFLAKAYALDSSRVELLSDLGMVYGMGRNFEKALYFFNRAYSFNSKDATLINNIANTYFFMGNKAKADEFFNKLPKHK